MKYLTLCLLVIFGLVNFVFAECQITTPSGLCWPTEGTGLLLEWHKLNSEYIGKLHLGQDISASENDDVYAVADGTVVESRMDVGGYGGVGIDGGGVVIQHHDNNIGTFTVVYAHLKEISIGTTVTKGQIIAKVGPYVGGLDHLHFGLRIPANSDAYRWTGYDTVDRGFVDPMSVFNRIYYRYVQDSDNYGNLTTIYWKPANVSCKNATSWCYGTCSSSHTSAVCNQAYDKLLDINYFKYVQGDWYNTFFGNTDLSEVGNQCSD